MKTVEISDQLEQVLNLIAAGVPLNLMERMEVSIFSEVLKNTPHEVGTPEWRSKYNWMKE